MAAVNTFPNVDNYLSSYTLGVVQNIQGDLDRKLAKMAKTEMYSTKNDLGCQINKQGAKRLGIYKDILEGIMKCEGCYKEYFIDDIVSLIKNEISKN